MIWLFHKLGVRVLSVFETRALPLEVYDRDPDTPICSSSGVAPLARPAACSCTSKNLIRVPDAEISPTFWGLKSNTLHLSWVIGAPRDTDEALRLSLTHPGAHSAFAAGCGSLEGHKPSGSQVAAQLLQERLEVFFCVSLVFLEYFL